MPEDVKQACLWIARGYERRQLEYQSHPSAQTERHAQELRRMEAVEQALVSVGADIQAEEVREQLRKAILLNVESGRAYPYERLGVECMGRSEFYRRKDRFLADIAAYLGML